MEDTSAAGAADPREGRILHFNLNERHLRQILRDHFAYYHASRTHLAVDKDCPEHREVEPPKRGEIVAFSEVGGLHHRCTRRAA